MSLLLGAGIGVGEGGNRKGFVADIVVNFEYL